MYATVSVNFFVAIVGIMSEVLEIQIRAIRQVEENN